MPSAWGDVLEDEDLPSPIRAARFAGEARHRDEIEDDDDLLDLIEAAQRRGGALNARRHMLSQAVRVTSRVLPSVDKAFRDVQERAQIDEPLEAYVYAGAEINAAVLPVRNRKLVLFSSATVERLQPAELEFVIGHELGHALLGHLDVPVGAIIQRNQGLNPRTAMRLMAWQRAAEISADRVGLLCCGALDVAATALFKTVSGLSLEGLHVDPHEFANQWDELAQEVRREGAEDFWTATHPFPPLRMKALNLFWRTRVAKRFLRESPGDRELGQADDAIERYLGLVDPLARSETEGPSAADPLLVPFLVWGGLFIAAADGRVEKSELKSLKNLVGSEAVDRALKGCKPSAREFRKRFLTAKKERRQALSALEIQRIFVGLVAVAWADGHVDDSEVKALGKLADACGISPTFVEVLIDKHGDA